MNVEIIIGFAGLFLTVVGLWVIDWFERQRARRVLRKDIGEDMGRRFDEAREHMDARFAEAREHFDKRFYETFR